MIPYSIKTGYNHINSILSKIEGKYPFFLRKLPLMNNAELSVTGFGEI
jgi:hypothetical protein